jgi:hypothetical protein
MTATFSFDVDPARDLVQITMAGFFTPADIIAFRAEQDSEHRKLTCAPNHHLTINDITGMKVQSQEMVASFQAVLANPAHRSRRLAFIVSRTLARSQVMRALNGRHARCFENRAEAEAWLFAPEETAAAA